MGVKSVLLSEEDLGDESLVVRLLICYFAGGEQMKGAQDHEQAELGAGGTAVPVRWQATCTTMGRKATTTC